MVRTGDITAIETLQKRFKVRLVLGLSLARAYRFVVELEPFVGDGPDPFVELAGVFKDWRQALRYADAETALDAVGRGPDRARGHGRRRSWRCAWERSATN